MARGQRISIRLGETAYLALIVAATGCIVSAQAGLLHFTSMDSGVTWRLVRVEMGGAA